MYIYMYIYTVVCQTVFIVTVNIIRLIKRRRMGWAAHAACMGDIRGVYRVLVGRLDGKRPLGTPRRRWEDNIKMNFQEVEWGGMVCSG
jgi:hypothetical protein